MSARYRNYLWCAAIVAWGTAATAVWCWATTYEFTTYDTASSPAPQHWPVGSTLVLSENRPTLLLFLHPRCPCSRATVHELTRVIDRLPDDERPHLTIVATLPADATPEWRESDTVESALKLPHTSVVWDTDGATAHTFGATSSGTVQLYKPDGKLLFAGGVTASRGHQGDNAGSNALGQLLTQSSTEPTKSTPVFGCRLCLGDATKSGAAGCSDQNGACAIELAGETR